MSQFPVRVSAAEFRAIRARAAEKKAKRTAKGLALGLRKPRKRRKPLARSAAFKRLKELCREFVMLRAKFRTGGVCEVAMECAGMGPLEVAYHITPQAMGNALKYDPRNLLGSCNRCNGSEFFARKRGSNLYRDRHAAILGDVFTQLEAEAGRKSISTAEANGMADKFKLRIENGEWRMLGAS